MVCKATESLSPAKMLLPAFIVYREPNPDKDACPPPLVPRLQRPTANTPAWKILQAFRNVTKEWTSDEGMRKMERS